MADRPINKKILDELKSFRINNGFSPTMIFMHPEFYDSWVEETVWYINALPSKPYPLVDIYGMMVIVEVNYEKDVFKLT